MSGLRRKGPRGEDMFMRLKNSGRVNRKLYQELLAEGVLHKFVESLSFIRVVLGSPDCVAPPPEYDTDQV